MSDKLKVPEGCTCICGWRAIGNTSGYRTSIRCACCDDGDCPVHEKFRTMPVVEISKEEFRRMYPPAAPKVGK